MSVFGKLDDAILSAESSGLPVHQAEVTNRLEVRLLSCRQYLVLNSTLGFVLGEHRVLRTAELYRLQALVYLERACGESLGYLLRSYAF